MEHRPAADPSFDGLRVLVVEDEAMVRMLIEDMLADLGCVIAATASRLDGAISIARSADVDVAILDLNLFGSASWPVVDVLLERGVPFILSTGYQAAAFPPAMANATTLSKPFTLPDLIRALSDAIAGRSKTDAHAPVATESVPSSSSSP